QTVIVQWLYMVKATTLFRMPAYQRRTYPQALIKWCSPPTKAQVPYLSTSKSNKIKRMNHANHRPIQFRARYRFKVTLPSVADAHLALSIIPPLSNPHRIDLHGNGRNHLAGRGR